jgi:hypothetical protein
VVKDWDPAKTPLSPLFPNTVQEVLAKLIGKKKKKERLKVSHSGKKKEDYFYSQMVLCGSRKLHRFHKNYPSTAINQFTIAASTR